MCSCFYSASIVSLILCFSCSCISFQFREFSISSQRWSGTLEIKKNEITALSAIGFIVYISKVWKILLRAMSNIPQGLCKPLELSLEFWLEYVRWTIARVIYTTEELKNLCSWVSDFSMRKASLLSPPASPKNHAFYLALFKEGKCSLVSRSRALFQWKKVIVVG